MDLILQYRKSYKVTAFYFYKNGLQTFSISYGRSNDSNHYFRKSTVYSQMYQNAFSNYITTVHNGT